MRDSRPREEGAIFKDWGGKLPVALIYPNTYFVGMSSLGLQTLYQLLNSRADVVCERAFYKPCEGSQPSQGSISLESQRPLSDFGLLAFTLSYEMDYFHVVEMLRQRIFGIGCKRLVHHVIHGRSILDL